MMYCQNCGCKLSAKEFDDIQKAMDECSFSEMVKRLCFACEEEEDNMEEAIDDVWDGDPGL